MSEEQGQADNQASAGTLLRQAREAQGLHVAALAVALKVPVRKLEALESDRFDLLPDAVFVRALASSVCRTLKIDPQPVLERLPRTTVPRLIQDQDGINAPFRAPSDGAGPSWLDQLSRPVFLTVIALLLGALVLIFLPSLQRDESMQASATDAQVMPMPAVIQAPAEGPVGPAATVTSALPVAPAAPAAVVATPARTVPVAVSPTTSIPAVVSPTAIVTPSAAVANSVTAAAAASAAGGQPANGIVVFRTKAASWVEVTDAKGVVALRRILAAGESAAASGTLPLAVTIGSASATEVQVRGKAFDLAPVSRDNVARFEVR